MVAKSFCRVKTHLSKVQMESTYKMLMHLLFFVLMFWKDKPTYRKQWAVDLCEISDFSWGLKIPEHQDIEISMEMKYCERMREKDYTKLNS